MCLLTDKALTFNDEENVNFSILTASYNSLAFISSALSSVQSQKGVDLEHIVIDGDSVDGTKEFLLKLNDGTKVICEKDMGIYDALNKGLLASRNDIVGILHTDDIFSDEFVLSDVLTQFNNGADVLYADLEYVKRGDISKVFRKWRAGIYNKNELELGWMPPHPTFFFKRSILNESDFFNLEYRISSDYDFMLRVLSIKGLNVQYLPRVITKMRVGGESNKSLVNLFIKSFEDYKITKKYFRSPLGTLFCKNLRKIKQIQLFSVKR